VEDFRICAWSDFTRRVYSCIANNIEWRHLRVFAGDDVVAWLSR